MGPSAMAAVEGRADWDRPCPANRVSRGPDEAESDSRPHTASIERVSGIHDRNLSGERDRRGTNGLAVGDVLRPEMTPWC